ncbi:hypothetical protein crov225 [Cafeteria roenbergensis virus]|uniref:Uncharacterized protein n=1 Tax=Cafeteria roenbergensis virus (strain BV-PW1) TaxID=693272 RepID=E3T4Z5_CROVB|nr:hypothetical protein crov225 [Cafeteria roenbergensis virus BV-PW1]ADO67258.1 hypothetical protein crov225 [Cafeteria roenbergensis virus BV-PW1]
MKTNIYINTTNNNSTNKLNYINQYGKGSIDYISDSKICLHEYINFKVIKDDCITDQTTIIKTSLLKEDIKDKTFEEIFHENSKKINEISSVEKIKSKIISKFKGLQYINRSTLLFNFKSISKPFKELTNIKHLIHGLTIDGFSHEIEKEFIKLYKNSLEIKNYVIINFYSYNVGTKGIDQQINMDLLPFSKGHIDLFLVDPNFGNCNHYDIPQVYDQRDFKQDTEFNVIIKSEPSKIIRKYDNEKKNLTVYTIPMLIPETTELFPSKISVDHIIRKHPNLMSVTYTYFENKSKELKFD